jgi:hypothetical protein
MGARVAGCGLATGLFAKPHLPAAVIWPVKKRPKWWAASTTAL